MNARMRKRIFSSILAGTMVLSIPISAGATSTGVGGNQGGTSGEGNLPYATGDVFDVVLPTNYIRNLNYTLDPANKITGGKLVGMDEETIKLYDPASKVYFNRIDFDDTEAGSNNQLVEGESKKTLQSLWGKVTNIINDKKFGNTSSWIVATNKGTQNVVVELTAKWTDDGREDGVRIVPTEAELATATDPAMYMEIQAATGFTYGKNEFQELEEPVGGVDTRLSVAFDKVEDDGTMKVKALNSPTGGTPVLGNGVSTYLSYYIPTVNQNFPIKDNQNPDWYRVDGEYFKDLETDELAYYLKTETNADGSIKPESTRLWDNRTVMVAGQLPDNTLEKVYDQNVDFYPTYGFRLYGNVNSVSSWEETDVYPTLNLRWRITNANNIGQINVPLPIVTPEIDILGATEKQLAWVNYNQSGAVLEKITWIDRDGNEQDLWNKSKGGEIIGGTYNFENPSIPTVTGPYIQVDDPDNAGRQRVWITIIPIYNWSSNGYFHDDKHVVLYFHFSGVESLTQPLELTIHDSIGQTTN